MTSALCGFAGNPSRFEALEKNITCEAKWHLVFLRELIFIVPFSLKTFPSCCGRSCDQSQ